MSTTLSNLVIVSDLHCGCQFGLCPPGGVQLEGSGRYQPSRYQQVLWGRWRHFWDRAVPAATHGEPFAVVCNGDAIDGRHHDSTTQITHNLADQANIAYEVLAPIVERCDGRYYHVRGTEAHVGKSGVEEERLAQRLGAVRDEDGWYSRYVLWARMPGGLVNIMHHIGTTSSSAHESSAVNAEWTACLVEAARWGVEPPRVVVRSHRHRCIEIRPPMAGGTATVIVTPGWQLKTPYVYRIAGGRNSEPQIGGVVIRQGDEGLYAKPIVWSLARPQEETLCLTIPSTSPCRSSCAQSNRQSRSQGRRG